MAHCRDAYDMIGGTLANHVERGDKVTVAVISSENYSDALRLRDHIRKGAACFSKKALARESEIHRKHMKEAMSILGIKDVRFINQKGILIKHDNTVAYRIADLIQEIRPEIMVTHHPDENAGIGDHPACGRAAFDGMWLAQCSRPGGKVVNRPAQIFTICPPGDTTRLDWETVNRYPAIQIDVTWQVEKKLKALASLETQYASKRLAAKELEMVSGVAALHPRISYMEAFQNCFPEIYECLPVNERALAFMNSSEKEKVDQVRLIAPYLPGVQDDVQREDKITERRRRYYESKKI